MTCARPAEPGLHLHAVATRSNPYHRLVWLFGTVGELALTHITILYFIAP